MTAKKLIILLLTVPLIGFIILVVVGTVGQNIEAKKQALIDADRQVTIAQWNTYNADRLEQERLDTEQDRLNREQEEREVIALVNKLIKEQEYADYMKKINQHIVKAQRRAVEYSMCDMRAYHRAVERYNADDYSMSADDMKQGINDAVVVGLGYNYIMANGGSEFFDKQYDKELGLVVIE